MKNEINMKNKLQNKFSWIESSEYSKLKINQNILKKLRKIKIARINSNTDFYLIFKFFFQDENNRIYFYFIFYFSIETLR